MPKKNVESLDNEIINFYEHKDTKEFIHKYENPNFELNQMSVPFMACVCSQTGGGKTNMIMNLLKRFDGTFSQIAVLNSGESEPLYDFLKKKLKKGLIITNKVSDMPSLQELGEEKDAQKLLIFDDCINNKSVEPYILELYKRGRKCGCSCLYLSQSFFGTPSFIRKQLHYLFLLRLSGKRDVKAILSNYALGISPESLIEIYKDATKEDLNFLKIDVRTKNEGKRFSRNFTGFYEIETEF